MSGRDLLYKPPVPLQLPDEESKPEKAKGQKVRDLGGVPSEAPRGVGPQRGTPAYKAAYFNRDTSGVHESNLRGSSMQALRGGEEVVDLKKVVLPGALGVESPNPDDLRAAGDLMGLAGGEHGLPDLLGRQKSWLHGKGVTAEMIKARLAQLKEMVEARRAALKRMLQGRAARRAGSVTLDQAASAQGQALEQATDVAAQGSELVRRAGAQAEGMHRRIAKALGIKPPKS